MSRPADLPGRDRRAERHPAPAPARPCRAGRPSVAVIGGGIAGLAAAAVLAERDVDVTVIEQRDQLGGRVRAWPLGDGRTMSRGFHAFFRQYYNLRALLRRADPQLRALTAVPDYPLVSGSGARDSFARIPRTPPWNLATFVARSETFPLRALLDVDVASALELLDVDFPQTFTDYDGQSAADFLARLRFPDAARHLALEVFARSFFARPEEFGAGELISMFHAYFVGSAEGLLFDVPNDDYDTALWAPLGRYLRDLKVNVRNGASVSGIERRADGVVLATSTGELIADAVVVAADPRTARALIESSALGDSGWRERVASTRSAPPFGVWRLWLRDAVAADRLPFLGTAGFGPLDNISVLERFERGAANWTRANGGSVVELHAYALDPSYDAAAVQRELRAALSSIYPETREVDAVAEEWLVADDCPLIGTGPWNQRPGVATPDERVVLAGDWVRCDYPVALMERAATTGMLAANRLLAGEGRPGADVWTVPMRGRHRIAAPLRRLLARRGAVGRRLMTARP